MAGIAGMGLTAVTTLAEASGMEFPSIKDFLPPTILFQGTPFAMNRIILVRVVMMVILLVVLGITALRAKLIPGRWQGAVEWLIEFVQNSIVYEVMGELRGKRYVPMITTIFFSIFAFNLCGIIPGMNIAATATVTMPLAFALWVLLQYWYTGIRERGLGKFLRDEMFPAGVPWPVYILLAPIQLIELLLIRPFSLTIRLFANMISGHLLVALCYAGTQYLFFYAAEKWKIGIGVFTLGGGLFMTLFEIAVAALQAFIFAVLATSYINMSLPETEE